MKNTERSKGLAKQSKGVAVKLDDELARRVREHQLELQKRADVGARISFAGALANLVARGLAA